MLIRSWGEPTSRGKNYQLADTRQNHESDKNPIQPIRIPMTKRVKSDKKKRKRVTERKPRDHNARFITATLLRDLKMVIWHGG